MSVTDRVLSLGELCTVATVSGEPGSHPDAEPPLLLLHAWAESRRSFCRLAPRLPPTTCTASIDLRGHGDADRPPRGYLLDDLASDVACALDELEFERAVLVGASSGGYVAQQVALRSPDRVAGLVLVGAPRDLRGPAPFAAEVEALRDPVDPAWVRAFIAGFASPLVPTSFVELMAVEARRLPADVWRASLAGLTGSPPPSSLGRITAPALVISGARDQLVDRAQTAALVDELPAAEWIEYENTGHAVLWERPERLAADIEAFLARITSARSGRDHPADARPAR